MYPKRNWYQLTKLEIAILILTIGLLLALLIPPTTCVNSHRSTYCLSNQKNIALAMHAYREHYSQFPPAYVTDADGNPLYSWRVLLLPFLEQEEFYNKLHLDEPWDSPHNKKLLDKVKWDSRFCCIDHKDLHPNTTNHFLVTGPGTIWDDGIHSSAWDEIDFPEQTIMLIDANVSDVHWAEPKDFNLDNIDSRFLDEDGRLKMNHPLRFLVSFADGHQEYLDVTFNDLLATIKKQSQIKQEKLLTKKE